MSAATENGTIRPFQIEISEEQLVDLRTRVSATKFPERETVTDQSQGVQLAMIQKLARYWATEYDWRKCEAKLKALRHFMTEIDELDFIHAHSWRNRFFGRRKDGGARSSEGEIDGSNGS